MNDRGHAGLELALGAGLLLLPVAILVLAFGPWSERRVGAEALAAEGARAAVLALDEAAGGHAIADQAGDLGLDLSHVRLGWCGVTPSAPAAGSCSFARGTVVVATVEVWAPLIATPFGPIGGIWVRGEHSEPIDLYRSLP